MRNKPIILTLLFACFSAVSFSQIQQGLYTNSQDWYVLVQGDTAYTESIGQKKYVNVWKWPGTRDTLLKQDTANYKGAKYKLTAEGGKTRIIDISADGKKMRLARLYPANDQDKQNWNKLRNMVVLNTLYHKYPKLQNNNDILEEFYLLEDKAGMSQQEFLQEVRKFEEQHLKE